MHKGANGWQGARAVGCLPALTGNLGIPGGGFGPRHGARSHGQGSTTSRCMDAAAARRYVPNQMPRITEALVDGRASRALLLFGTDMLSSFADAGRARRRAGAAPDLVVSHDLFLNDTARGASPTWCCPARRGWRSLAARAPITHLYLMEPALPPAGEVAHRWPRCCEGWPRASAWSGFYPGRIAAGVLDATHRPSGDGPCHGGGAAGARAASARSSVSPVAHPDLVFPTPSGKVELVSERAASLGLPDLPVYEPLPDSPIR